MMLLYRHLISCLSVSNLRAHVTNNQKPYIHVDPCGCIISVDFLGVQFKASFTRAQTYVCADEFCSWTQCLFTWICANSVTDCSGIYMVPCKF